MQVIRVAIDERQRDQRRARDQGEDDVAHAHERLASRPVGRMNIITMKKANAST